MTSDRDEQEHSASEQIPVAVVLAVAEAEGLDPTELTPPLGEVVEADALERLLRDSQNDVRVTLEYHGRAVEIQPDGSVSVRKAETDK